VAGASVAWGCVAGGWVAGGGAAQAEANKTKMMTKLMVKYLLDMVFSPRSDLIFFKRNGA